MNIKQSAQSIFEDFEFISTEGNFSLYVLAPTYKTYSTKQGYIRNTKTSKNCGTEVRLRKHFYHDGKYLDDPVLDEDCYEIVQEDDQHD